MLLWHIISFIFIISFPTFLSGKEILVYIWSSNLIWGIHSYVKFGFKVSYIGIYIYCLLKMHPFLLSWALVSMTYFSSYFLPFLYSDSFIISLCILFLSSFFLFLLSLWMFKPRSLWVCPYMWLADEMNGFPHGSLKRGRRQDSTLHKFLCSVGTARISGVVKWGLPAGCVTPDSWGIRHHPCRSPVDTSWIQRRSQESQRRPDSKETILKGFFVQGKGLKK